MANAELNFHFGFTLEGDEAQLLYFDDSASSTYEIIIPAGTYYFKHDTASKSITEEITTLITAQFAGTTNFDITVLNDRQIEWTLDDTNDTILLINTANDDAAKLATALGLYDNDGDLEYYINNEIESGVVTNNTLSSWFSEGGRVYNTESLLGFDIANAEIYETEGGSITYASGSIKAVLGDVRWTGIESTAVRGGWPYSTQTALGTTENATWSTSIWRASNPELMTPMFYAEIGSTPLKYEFGLREPLKYESAKQIRPGWTQHFDLTTKLIMLEDLN